jgi:hypothetical protein
MAIGSMTNIAVNEREILLRLASVEGELVEDNTSNENEDKEFDKLHSMIPYLTSKSTTQLDIVLEAITYINMLQNKLIENVQA